MWEQVKPEQMLVGNYNRESRTISNTVIEGWIPLPPMTEADNDLWSEHIGGAGFTEVGAIAIFGEDTGLITPTIQAAIDAWLIAQDVHASRRHPALPLACTGASYHHDAESYTDEIFCVLWLSDDVEWDVYFPCLEKRIPLTYGTIFVFDSAQPHGVVARGETVFDEDTFEYATGVFASQDLVLGHKARQRMGIKSCSRKGKTGMHVINSNAFREELSPSTGAWHIFKHK